MVEPEPDTKVLPAGGARSAPSQEGDGAPLRRRIGRYEVLQRLASGGMATVYLGRATGSAGFEKLVAIKVIHPHLADDPDLVEMFLDEGRIASRIHSPHVVEILDLGEDRGDYYMVMEFVDGVTLSSLVRELRPQNERLPLPVVLRLVADACEGLRAAHELRDPQGHLYGLIHRDVSPQNLMVDFDGWVRVADFGIMKAKGRRSDTRSGQIRGKLAYMSPEQAQSLPLTPASDLFALGVVLWELLTGERLFVGDSEAETLARVLRCQRPPLATLRPDLPAEIEGVLAKTLAREPGERFPSAEVMLVELRRLLHLFAGPEEPRAQLAGVLRARFGEQASYRRAAASRAAGESGPVEVATRVERGPATKGRSEGEADADVTARVDRVAEAASMGVDAVRQGASRAPSGRVTAGDAALSRARTGADVTPGDEVTRPDALAASATLEGTASGSSRWVTLTPAPQAEPSGVTSAAAGPMSTASGRGRKWGVWLGLPLAGALVAIVGLSWASSLRGEPARATPEVAAAAESVEAPEVGEATGAGAPAEAAPAEVRWTLNTEPPGASVVIRGAAPEVQVGIDAQVAGQVTPVAVILPRSEARALTLTFRLAGHEEQTEMRLPLASENIDRVLRPIVASGPGAEAAKRPRRGEVRLSVKSPPPSEATTTATPTSDPLAEPTFAKPLRRKSREGE